jgi:hypothetical protein
MTALDQGAPHLANQDRRRLGWIWSADRLLWAAHVLDAGRPSGNWGGLGRGRWCGGSGLGLWCRGGRLRGRGRRNLGLDNRRLRLQRHEHGRSRRRHDRLRCRKLRARDKLAASRLGFVGRRHGPTVSPAGVRSSARRRHQPSRSRFRRSKRRGVRQASKPLRAYSGGELWGAARKADGGIAQGDREPDAGPTAANSSANPSGGHGDTHPAGDGCDQSSRPGFGDPWTRAGRTRRTCSFPTAQDQPMQATGP